MKFILPETCPLCNGEFIFANDGLHFKCENYYLPICKYFSGWIDKTITFRLENEWESKFLFFDYARNKIDLCSRGDAALRLPSIDLDFSDKNAVAQFLNLLPKLLLLY